MRNGRARERTALITGATGALGGRAAERLIGTPGWRVIIVGRNPAAVASTVERLGERTTGCVVDLARLADVEQTATRLPPVDALICAAGVHSVTGTRWTADGFEETFAVNHLAHFLLIRAVAHRMVTPGRVVLVSSGTHDPARRTGFPPPTYTTATDLARPEPERTESAFRSGRRRYTASKLCNVMTAYEFARRVPATVATFNAFDPGQMPGTGIARDYGTVRSFAWRHVLPAIAALPFTSMTTPDRSAAALTRLLVDPALSTVTGRYYDGTNPRRSSTDSYDAAKCADLWQTSEALIALAAEAGAT